MWLRNFSRFPSKKLGPPVKGVLECSDMICITVPCKNCWSDVGLYRSLYWVLMVGQDLGQKDKDLYGFLDAQIQTFFSSAKYFRH